LGEKGSGGNSWAVKIKTKAPASGPLSECGPLSVWYIWKKGIGLKINIKYSLSMFILSFLQPVSKKMTVSLKKMQDASGWYIG
jgi:hypothetical protein